MEFVVLGRIWQELINLTFIYPGQFFWDQNFYQGKLVDKATKS